MWLCPQHPPLAHDSTATCLLLPAVCPPRPLCALTLYRALYKRKYHPPIPPVRRYTVPKMKLTMLFNISVLILATGVEAIVAPTPSTVAVAAREADALTPKNCDALDNFKEVCQKKDRKQVNKACSGETQKKCTNLCKKNKKLAAHLILRSS